MLALVRIVRGAKSCPERRVRTLSASSRSARRRWRWRFGSHLMPLILVLSLVVVGGQAMTPWVATTQTPTTDTSSLTTYQSPTAGYRLSWEPETWPEHSANASASGDSLTLVGEDPKDLTIASRIGDTTEPADCVAGLTDERIEAGGQRDIRPGLNALGEPFTGTTGTAAYAVYTYAMIGDHGEFIGHATSYVECRRIDSGESLLVIRARVIGPSRFNASIPLAFDVIATIQEPGAAAPTPLTVPVDRVFLAET